ncbi:MAG: hypothetical protein HC897_09020 [Thermoanaerobaculia bacterium]|nr:hypothetical protein [Thermoanaerobaculia bacterium]
MGAAPTYRADLQLQAGQYPVSLKVIDSDGAEDAANATVTIIPPVPGDVWIVRGEVVK